MTSRRANKVTPLSNDLRIGILGTGRVSRVLATKLSAQGKPVRVGSRDSEKAKSHIEFQHPKIVLTSNQDAVSGSDLIFCAIPWQATEKTLPSLGPWTGKILVDCVNPINKTFTGLDLGFDTSAAEKIASWVPGATVLKALNTASTETMLHPQFGDRAATMFYCGDDGEAKGHLSELLANFGFDPIDCGDLIMARYLEPMAMLYIQLAIRQGFGPGCALAMLQRTNV